MPDASTPSERRVLLPATLVLIVMLIVAITSATIVRSFVDDEDKSLLEKRTDDMETVSDAFFNERVAVLENVDASIDADTNIASALNRAGAPLVATGRFSGVSLMRVTASGVTTVQKVGTTPAIGIVSDPGIIDTARRAVAIPLAITAAPIGIRGGVRHFGLAMHTRNLAADQLLYLEQSLEPAGTQRLGEFAPFGELRAAMYLGANPATAQLIVANTDELPLERDVNSRVLTYGNDTYLLTANARMPLTGSLARALPSVVFGFGIFTAVLVTVIVAVLQRRRRYALALVDERTEELTHTLAQVRARADRDHMLREVFMDVAAAPDIASAIDALYRTVSQHLSVDRAAICRVVGFAEVEVIAAAGPRATEVHPGQRVPIPNEVLTNEHPMSVADWPNYRLGMQAAATIPLIAGGRPSALITIASLTADAYTPEEIGLLEELGHETTPVFTQLLVLEREREATAQAQALDQLKTEFVGIVAHDLRSPMTVISGFADVLRSNGDKLTTEQKNNFLERISNSIANLARLVEDVLQVARIDSGELDCKDAPFDFVALAKRTSEEVASTFPQRELRFTADDIPTAYGDEQRQWQVLANLVSNAFKYSSTGPVELRIDVAESYLRVSIEDHGIGIHEDDLPKLFQKFSRVVQPGGNRATGTGLGLYIARSIIETEGGTVSVASAVGKGTTFTYTLPIFDDARQREYATAQH